MGTDKNIKLHIVTDIKMMKNIHYGKSAFTLVEDFGVERSIQVVMTSLIISGLGIAGAAYAGRFALRAAKKVDWMKVKKAIPDLPDLSLNAYYKGGFDAKMSKREAALVLGVSQNANTQKVRDSHRRIMIANHPDKGALLILLRRSTKLKTLWRERRKEVESRNEDIYLFILFI